MQHGKFLDTFRTPGYPAFLALIFALSGGDNYGWVVYVQAFLIVLAAVQVYILTYRLSGRRWLAALVGAAVGGNLYIVTWERAILSETLGYFMAVTLGYYFERYIRTGSRVILFWLALLSAYAILVRPIFIYLPALLFVMAALHSLLQRKLRQRLGYIVVAAAVTFGIIGAYTHANGVTNGYYGLSTVSDINLFGKVLEYHMQNEATDPQYAKTVTRANQFVQTGAYLRFGGVDPYGFFNTYPIYANNNYQSIGAYSRNIILSHPTEFAQKTLPDIKTTLTDKPVFYARTQRNQRFVPTAMNLSQSMLGVYYLLGPLLLFLLFWLCRRPRNDQTLILLTLLLAVIGTVVTTAAGSYATFWRLRFPIDWAMILVAAVVVVEAAAALARRNSVLFAVAQVSRSANLAFAPAKVIPISLPDRAMPNDNFHQVVIMGAGPAGLTAAYELTRHGIPLTIFEQDQTYVGGISRTVEYNGYRFDIGGHRFFSKSQEIEDLWTEILGPELLTRPRLSRIYYKGKYFDYPLKAANALLNLGPIETVRCLMSYAQARLHPVKHPKTFEDWVTNQFGQRLFEIFFKTYTEKVWGISTKELSADWAAQRIKGLSLGAAIKNALIPPQAGDAVIKTLIDEFRYPRLGPGQMWERARDLVQARGQRILLGQEVVSIRHDGQQVVSVLVRDQQGVVREMRATHFISTIPLRQLVERCDPPLPPVVQQAARGLKYRDFLTVAVLIAKPDIFPDNWIYLHDPGVVVGRIQNFKNWSPDMVAYPGKTCLGMEYFCFEGDGLWDRSDQALVRLAAHELAQLGMCRPEDVLGGVVVRQPKAYPVYDEVYKQHLAVIREYIEARLVNLHVVGRNGMHHYNNQDHSMMTALLAARNIATGAQFDPWNVNTDAEYHEGTRDAEDQSGRLVPQRLPIETSRA